MPNCRHLGSVPIGRLRDILSEASGDSECICLTCGVAFPTPTSKEAGKHAREKNHPISHTGNSLYCHVCGSEPQVSSAKDRKLLERILESVKSTPKQKRTIEKSSFSTEASPLSQPPKGIVNLANTCFMNATLQSLAACQVLPSSTETSKSSTWTQLLATLHSITHPDKSKLAPRGLLNAVSKRYPKFGTFQQQDAHEFLRCLFNCVGEEEPKPAPYEPGFLGKMVSRVTCGRCRRVSDTEEPFLDVALSLTNNQKDYSQMERSFSRISLSSESELSESDSVDEDTLLLKDLFRNWSAPISLSGENGYYCENCAPKDPSILQSATLIYRLARLPPILVIHLQRFRTVLVTSSGSGKRKKGVNGALHLDVQKDHRQIKYPLHLQLPKQAFLDDNDAQVEYELVGLIEHDGSSTGSGHYTAIVNYSGSFYYASDTRVSSVSQQRALSANPYILFYRRK